MKLKPKQMTATASLNKVKDYFKDKNLKIKRDSLRPGDLSFGFYDAKFKNQVYDKRPFFILLKQNKTHILGLNMHWLPMPMRISLVKFILKVNSNNIKNNKPLEFSYEQFKPLLKKMGYAPCIRLYIRKRMGSSLIKIPPSELMNACKLDTAVFSNGESAESLYRKAVQNVKQYRATRKRRE